MATVLSRLQILLHADTANFKKDIRKATDDAGKSFDKLKDTAKTSARAVALAGTAIATATAGMAMALVPVQRQFDVMNGQLMTATGSMEGASHAMEALGKFASQTPYDLEQSVIGFTKLVNLGLTPSERAMTSYGNTASAMGKSLEQMIEAVADASTFEFERLKEFGIKSSQEGDRVKFTFQGITTEVGKNAQEIEDYLMAIGEVNFAGAMEAQMDTLNGRISQAGIAFDDFRLAIAQSGIGDMMKSAVEEATGALEGMTQFIKSGQLQDTIDLLGISFDGFKGVATRAVDKIKSHLGIGLANMGEANDRTVQAMAYRWTRWSVNFQATIAEAVVNGMSWLEKFIIKSKTAGKIAMQPLNPFNVIQSWGEGQTELRALEAQTAQTLGVIQARQERLLAENEEAFKKAKETLEALGKATEDAGDQLAQYGLAKQKIIAQTEEQAKKEKDLAKQREKEARDRIRQLEEQNRLLHQANLAVEAFEAKLDPVEGLNVRFRREWDELENALTVRGTSPEDIAGKYYTAFGKLHAQAVMEEAVNLQRELEQYTHYLDNRLDRLHENFIQERALISAHARWTQAEKDRALKAVETEYHANARAFEREFLQSIKGIREPFIDEIYATATEAQWAIESVMDNFELDEGRRQIWVDALEERRDHEIELLKLIRDKEVANAYEGQKTKLQLIRQQYEFERRELALNKKLSEETREALATAINLNEAQAEADLRNKAEREFLRLGAQMGGMDAQFALADELAKRLEVVQEYEDAHTNVTEEAERMRDRIRTEFVNKAVMLTLASGESIAGGIAESLGVMMGKQSSAFKAMFAIQQSFVMASAGMNMHKAWSDAMAEGATTAQKMASASTIVSEFTRIMGAVKSMTLDLPGYRKGGYTGNAPVNATAGVVHGQEFVAHAEATRKYRPELEAMNKGTFKKSEGGGGTQVVNVSVNVNADGTASTEGQGKFGRELGHAISLAVKQQLVKEKRQGGLLYA